MTTKPKKKRSRLLRVVIVLAVVVAGLMGVGLLLPETYEGEARITLRVPPDKAWAAVSEHAALPVGGSQTLGVADKAAERGLPVWEEDLGASRLTVRTVEATPAERVVRTLADSVIPMTARWELTIRPEGDGCEVTLHQSTVIRRGTFHVPIFRLIMALGGKDAGPRSYLDALAERVGGAG